MGFVPDNKEDDVPRSTIFKMFLLIRKMLLDTKFTMNLDTSLFFSLNLINIKY